MSRQIQIRRGTKNQHASFTGAIGEVTMDTTNKTLRVHDGVTVGGNEMLSRRGFYSYITDCLTEIHQDINLEFSDGTITLKAGSRTYIPNEGDLFTAYDFKNNVTRSGAVSKPSFLVALFDKTSGAFVQLFTISIDNACSGVTDTLVSVKQHLWYDTANNVLRYYGNDGVTNSYYTSFPLAIVNGEGSAITSLDQVFNGFGYIGSTVFVLPGVKGLIPNGRNEDGTLKNFTMNNTIVRISTKTGPCSAIISMAQGGYLNTAEEMNYNSDTNFNYGDNGNVIRLNAGTFVCDSGGKVTSFNPKKVFSFVS